MAGDWIKMRTDLQSHPKIVRILSATNSDKFRVIGGLHAVWSVFDKHSTDGVLPGYTPDAMDHIIGWPGFSAALIAVNWIAFDGAETLIMPEFNEHNGQSAKRRAEDTKRKRIGRNSESCPQNVRNVSDGDADKSEKKSGPEKRREEKSKDQDLDSSLRSESSGQLNAEPAADQEKRAKEDATVQGIVDTYNAFAERNPGCKRTEVVTAKLRRKLLLVNLEARKLVKARGWAMPMREFWARYFEECEADDWLAGRVANPNNARWKQHLELLVDDTRFRQIMDNAIEAMRKAETGQVAA